VITLSKSSLLEGLHIQIMKTPSSTKLVGPENGSLSSYEAMRVITQHSLSLSISYSPTSNLVIYEILLVFVEDFVSLGGIPTRGHGVRCVEIFLGIRLLFRFRENSLGMKLRFHGLGDGPCGLVLGCHTHKEEYNILI
jgi:hypothetical protein